MEAMLTAETVIVRNWDIYSFQGNTHLESKTKLPR